MKIFKKLLRRLCLVVLILLASVGIGLAGGAPVPILARKEDSSEIRIELMDEKEAEDESADLK